MRAGPMRHRCMRRGYIEGKDALGQPSKGWGDLGKLWAEINIPSGRMYEAASQMQVTVTAEINIRYHVLAVADVDLSIHRDLHL